MRSGRNSIWRIIRLPANLPISLPSKLVDQRPDVRAAEANMHSASALVGVAIAARLPNIVLSANGGSTAYNLRPELYAGNRILYAGGQRDRADLRWLHALPQAEGGGSRARSGRSPVSRHRHHRIPERGGRLARPAVGCAAR